MKLTSIAELVGFLKRLETAGIYYRPDRYLDDSISIYVVVPGERWEIDVSKTGEIQVEVFTSNGEIYDENKIEELLDRFSC